MKDLGIFSGFFCLGEVSTSCYTCVLKGKILMYLG